MIRRFEASRPITLWTLVVLWLLSQILILQQFNDLYWSDTLPERFVPLLIAVIFAAAIFELLVLSSLAGLAKGLVRRRPTLFRRVLALALLMPGLFYFLSMGASWALHRLGVGFLDTNILRAFSLDTDLIIRHLTGFELTVAFGCLGAAGIAVLVVTMLSPVRDAARPLRAVLPWLAASLLVLVVGLRVVPATMSAADRSVYRVFVGHQVLPNLTLLWRWLLPQVTEARSPNLDERLSPRYGLEEYARAVDRNLARPHIIVFVVEALRSDVLSEVAAGVPVMPNLARLLDRGAVSTTLFAQSTESAYSMTSLATGLYPMKFGVRDTFVKLRYPHTRVYDAFSAGGYQTAFFSSANERWENMINLMQSPLLDVFFHSETAADTWSPDASRDQGLAFALRDGRLRTGKIDDAVTVQALNDWLRAQFRSGKGPNFAFVSLQASHFPYQQGKAVPRVFSPHEIPDDAREVSFLYYPPALAPIMKNRYRNSLRYIDGLVGEVVETVERAGQAESTIIVVVGDHGEAFYEHGDVTHGSGLWNTLVAVPAVIYAPGRTPRIASGRHGLLDLAPSLLTIADLPAHGNFQGQSFVDGLEGIRRSRPIFATVEGLSIIDSVVWQDWKFVLDHRTEKTSLFHITEDWEEKRDVLAVYPDLASCLERMLREYRSRQLTYYESPALTAKYFPPRYDDLADWCS